MWLPNKNQINTGVRYATVAATTAFTLLGLQAKGFSLDQAKQAIQAFGDLANNVVIIIGLVGGLVAAGKGVSSSSNASQIAAVKQIAEQPAIASSVNENQQAKQALVDATIALPGVQTIVVDKKTADASASPSVVAANDDSDGKAVA